MVNLFSRSLLRLVVSLSLPFLVLQAAPLGAVKGYVKDASGASIRDASLVLRDQKTGVQTESHSDANGLYQFLNLNPSIYTLSVTASGFSGREAKDITVLVGQIVSLDVDLSVASVSQSIEVAAGSEVLQTEKASTGINITDKLVGNLPLVNRRFNDLAILTPGTSFAAPGSQAGAFASAGTRSQSTNWQIDGANAIDPNVNGPTSSYRIAEAVQEFSVETTAYSAEFGRGSGAAVNVVTKSGTNQFHGSLFEFARNDAFQATDFFTNKLGGRKNILRYNQYGGSVGGPIWRDKTFFFYSFERADQNAPSATTAVVPTAAQRASVVDPIARNLLQFYPLPTAPNSPAGTTNFVGNTASQTKDNTHFVRIDHALGNADRFSGHYINYAGNTVSGGSSLPTTGGTTNSPSSQNGVFSEIHTFSPTFVSEGRVAFSRNRTNIRVQDVNVNAATILTNVPGVVDSNKDPVNAGIPTISITGLAGLGSATNQPQGRTSNTYELFWNNTKITNALGLSQTVHFGYYGRREETWRMLNGTSRGSLSFANFAQFAGTCPGCNGASQITTSSIRTGDTLGHWYRYPHAFYVQDDIKVRPNLTVNIGLRYELPSVLSEKRDKGTNFIPGIGPVLLGTNQVLGIDRTKLGPGSLTLTPGPVTLSSAGGVQPDYTNLGPTVGFAYTPNGGMKFLADGKTVIRGGFRIGYDDLFNNIAIDQASNAPWSLLTTQRAGVTQPGTYSWPVAFNQNVPLFSTTASGTPVGLVNFTSIARNAKQAYAENWNFTLQRSIARGNSIEVSYIGTSGHRLGVPLDVNQPNVIVNNSNVRGSQAPNVQVFPYPSWGPSVVRNLVGNSVYHGLVVSAKLQIANGLTMNTSYTWSHAIDNTSSFLGTTFDSATPASSNLPLDAQRGNSAYDQRHRFVNVFVYQLPFGRGRSVLPNASGWLNQIVGGWSLSGITNLASGQPFTVITNSNVDYSGFNQLNDRPNLLVNSLTFNRSNPDAFFSPLAFAPNGPGQVGTSPRNAYYGPGLINFDATLAKRFPLTERIGLELRGEFFNALNHTNFALTNANRNLSSGQFGQLSSTSTFNGGATGGPRVIQITGRITF
jgi:hypothetical protein